jgi:hypothetical protein
MVTKHKSKDSNLPKFDKIDVKGILENNPEFSDKIFEELLTKGVESTHIFLTEEQNLIYSMQ